MGTLERAGIYVHHYLGAARRDAVPVKEAMLG